MSLNARTPRIRAIFLAAATAIALAPAGAAAKPPTMKRLPGPVKKPVKPLPPPTAKAPRVARATPNNLALIPGGKTVKVLLEGDNLQQLKSARLVSKGVAVPGVKVALRLTRNPRRRVVILSAQAGAKPTTGAELWLFAAGMEKPIRPSVKIAIGSGPAPEEDTSSCPTLMRKTSLYVGPDTVVNGAKTTGKITLVSCDAPKGGLNVPLSSSFPQVGIVPTSVTIPEGKRTAEFVIKTGPIQSASEKVQIRARPKNQWSPSDADLTVKGPGLGAVVVPWIAFDSTGTATVTVRNSVGVTRPGIKVVKNSVQGPNVSVRIGSCLSTGSTTCYLSIPKGKTSGTFEVTVSKSPQQQVFDGDYSLLVTLGADTITKPLLLWPEMYLAHVSVGSQDLSTGCEEIRGDTGGKATGWVKLNHNAPPGGTKVTLSKSSTKSALADATTIPSSVTVPSGQKYASFPIDLAEVTETGSVLLKGSHVGAYDERINSFCVVAPPPFNALNGGATSVKGGETTNWRAVLVNRTDLGPVQVALSSSDPSVSVPSTVTVAKGTDQVWFELQTSSVAATKTVTITGTSGSQTRTRTLTVTP